MRDVATDPTRPCVDCGCTPDDECRACVERGACAPFVNGRCSSCAMDAEDERTVRRRVPLCSKCDGEGIIPSNRDDVDDARCPACGGTGEA